MWETKKEKSLTRVSRPCEGKEPSSLSNTRWLLLIICLSLSIFWILSLMNFSTSFMLWAVLKLCHTIPYFEYESALAGDDIVNVAVVIKDVRTKERVLAAQEFNLRSPKISIKVELHPASLSLLLTEYYNSIMSRWRLLKWMQTLQPLNK